MFGLPWDDLCIVWDLIDLIVPNFSFGSGVTCLLVLGSFCLVSLRFNGIILMTFVGNLWDFRSCPFLFINSWSRESSVLYFQFFWFGCRYVAYFWGLNSLHVGPLRVCVSLSLRSPQDMFGCWLKISFSGGRACQILDYQSTWWNGVDFGWSTGSFSVDVNPNWCWGGGLAA